MVRKFYESGVRAIFAGHYHRNAGGYYEDLEMVVTSAVGAQSMDGPNAKSGFRVVTVNENNITHKYVDIKQDETSRTDSITEISLIKLIFLLCVAYLIKRVIIQ